MISTIKANNLQWREGWLIMAYENILTETEGPVGIIRLNRPEALNALNSALISELKAALDDFSADDEIGCIIITGSSRAFAAGADITEMKDKTWPAIWLEDFLAEWDEIAATRKPVIAAVAGYALGGGCELAMMCDFIIAGRSARFGQPEIRLGIIPGAGGTQRLTRSVGKALAMDLILTGRMIDAGEALRAGLVSRVVDDAELMETALEAARAIASFSRPAVMAAREAVACAFETPLAEGVRAERRMFHALFASEGQKEGMAAFLEKRKPRFSGR